MFTKAFRLQVTIGIHRQVANMVTLYEQETQRPIWEEPVNPRPYHAKESIHHF
jgi:hypothetical protein